jgi:hypothetical protein
MKPVAERNIVVKATDDKSVTMAFKGEDGEGELMHSKYGAYSECAHVYLPAIEEFFSTFTQGRAMVFGLGMGYLEIFYVAKAIQMEKSLQNYPMISYESCEYLGESFRTWAVGGGKRGSMDLHSEYEGILERVSIGMRVAPTIVRDHLQQSYGARASEVRGAWTGRTDSEDPFSLILYDPFSPKSSPELWSSEYIKSFARSECGERCLFATYSANSLLKKTLKQEGFTLKKCIGYAGKRECTLAVR